MGKLEKSSQARVDAAEAAIEAVKKEIELLEKMEKLNLRMTKNQKEKLAALKRERAEQEKITKEKEEQKAFDEKLKTLGESKSTALEKIAKRQRDDVELKKNGFSLSARILNTTKANLKLLENAAKNKKIDVDLSAKLMDMTANVGDEETSLADLLSRILIQPAELPVGLVTSAIGSPFFLWLILKAQRK